MNSFSPLESRVYNLQLTGLRLCYCRIPIWYSLKLVLAAWLVLPQFKGAAFVYERYVREHITKFIGVQDRQFSHPESPIATGSGGRVKKKSVQFSTPD
ncbi:hypothetical protein NC651_028962 [Populus alba x Populus x berolinensis]|nr:hypothetical protein NC651_028962 [Populus alba x Populus x berolinensis]